MQIALIITLSLHILSTVFWAGTSFTLARTGGVGRENPVPAHVRGAVGGARSGGHWRPCDQKSAYRDGRRGWRAVALRQGPADSSRTARGDSRMHGGGALCLIAASLTMSDPPSPLRRERTAMPRLNVNDVIRRHELMNIHGQPVRIPDSERLVHLQFRRYAGCPACNVHLRSIVLRHDEI